jgi:hypothetical protein
LGVKFASDEYLRLKAEVSKKASMANKRLVRLENNNLTSTPAYHQWVNYKGGVKFSVKGKSYNELQQELARLNNFITSTTSTVRGANNVLKEIASNTGIKYGSIKELQAKSKQFFELTSKIQQYLRQTENSASAIGYRKIWEAINTYVQDEKIALGDANLDIDNLVERISQLTNYEAVEKGLEGYSSNGSPFEYF